MSNTSGINFNTIKIDAFTWYLLLTVERIYHNLTLDVVHYFNYILAFFYYLSKIKQK